MLNCKHDIHILILILLAILSSCTNNLVDNSHSDKGSLGNKVMLYDQVNRSAITNSLSNDKEMLTKIYTRAIAEFIKVVHRKDKTSFDTLFFGKHVYGQSDDFPDIDLPATIEGTNVRLISPELGSEILRKRKSMFYINMMGWVDHLNAEFILVLFSDGGKHQYDYFINFNYDTLQNDFILEKIEFENYMPNKDSNHKRFTIFIDNKYLIK